MTPKIKLLIADDHAIVRYGLNSLFSSQKDMVVVGQAKNGEEAVSLTLAERPDIVIMDLMMPKKDGSEATVEIKEKSPGTKILLLTSFGSYAGLSRALQAGAEGAILKTAEDETLVPTIRRIFNGEKVISSDIRRQLSENPPTAALTQKQLDILAAMTRGLSDDDIAKMLGIAKITVRAHVKPIFAKLGAANRVEAVAIALRTQLVKI